MAKSRVTTSGPDWTDLNLMMTAIEQYHGCRVSLGVELDRVQQTGGLLLVAGAVPLTGLPSDENSVVVGTRWPHHQHATFESALYRLLSQLDYKCGDTFWTQSNFDA